MTRPLSYIGLLLRRASQKSVLLTDQLTVLIVPFSTLVLWMAGAKMTATIQETLALGVAMTVIVVVLLRLMAASYFVWKDDQVEKKGLRKTLDDPNTAVAASLKAYTTERRKLLSEKLGTLSALANYKTEYLHLVGMDGAKIEPLFLEIDTLINQLSYDVPIRIAAIRLKEYCVDLLTGKTTDRQRLWAQRKLTFRLLHREDRISDLMTLVDIKMLTDADYQSDAEQESDVFKDLKEVILQLGDNYYTTEAEEYIRKALDEKDEENLKA